jgi:hypothetical protein
VSITVSMDLKNYPESLGPIVYQVTDVPVGDGPELTEADLVDNPSNWCGSLQVDVDNVEQTITITPEEACNFGIATVVVEGEGIGKLTTVTDDLWDNTTDPSCAMDLTEADASAGVATIEWQVPTLDPEVGCDSADMLDDGIAVFAYGEPEPTTTTTGPTATTEAPATTSRAAAAAAVAAARFTG